MNKSSMSESPIPYQAKETGKRYCQTPSGWLALVIIFIYGMIIILSFVPPLSVFFVIYLLFAGDSVLYLLLYIGLPGAIVAWVVATMVQDVKGVRRKALTWASFKYLIITFGFAGLLVGMASLGFPATGPRSRLGLLLYAKIHADVPAIRAWEQSCESGLVPLRYDDILSNPDKPIYTVDKEYWPERIIALSPRKVIFDRSDHTLTLAFRGVFNPWGLTVGPLGSKHNGVMKTEIEDGAWVWQSQRH